jgi:hypothetical protein
LAYANLRPRNLIVVRPRFDHVTGLGLPLDFLGGELEHLHAVVDARRENLVPFAGRLGGEGLDALLVHRVHGFGCRYACDRGGLVRTHGSTSLTRGRLRVRGFRLRLARSRDPGNDGAHGGAVSQEPPAAGLLVEEASGTRDLWCVGHGDFGGIVEL